MRDARGASTATMALVMLPFAAGLGVSADIGRIYMTKSKLPDAVSSAAFAASRNFQSSQDEREAFEMATAVFDLARPSGIIAGITEISIDRRSSEVSVRATATAPMALMGHVTTIARAMQIDASAVQTAPPQLPGAISLSD